MTWHPSKRSLAAVALIGLVALAGCADPGSETVTTENQNPGFETDTPEDPLTESPPETTEDEPQETETTEDEAAETTEDGMGNETTEDDSGGLDTTEPSLNETTDETGEP